MTLTYIPTQLDTSKLNAQKDMAIAVTNNGVRLNSWQI